MENTKPNKQGTAHLFYNGAVEMKDERTIHAHVSI